MTPLEKTTCAIQVWQERIQSLEKQIEKLSEVIGPIYYDTPIFAAMEAICSSYTSLLSDQIEDEGNWLEYYRFECLFGKKPRGVFPEPGVEIQITGPEALARVIRWGRENMEKAA